MRRLSNSLMLVVALAFAACSKAPAPDRSNTLPRGSVCVIQPSASNAFTAASRALLAELCPDAPVIALRDIESALADSLTFRMVVLIPDVRNLPAAARAPLLKFLDAGGVAVFWGMHPLEGDGTEKESPDLPMLSPTYRHYATTITAIQLAGASNAIATAGPLTVQCPVRRALGMGGEQAAPYRWIPLAKGLGEMREDRGSPVSIYIEPRGKAPPRQWAWVGIDPDAQNRKIVGECLRTVVRRLLAGQFLHHAGSVPFTFQPGESMNVSARWISGLSAEMGSRVQAELIDRGGTTLRRVVSAPRTEPLARGQEFEQLNLGLAPDVAHDTRNYIVRISLIDRTGNRVYDSVDQPVRILPPLARINEDWVTTSGPLFAIAGRPLSFLGVHYWPLNSTGFAPGEFHPHWLDPALFDPGQVVRDFERLREAGVNALSIQYLHEGEAPQLRYVIEEARMHRMWVHLFVSHLQPPDHDFAKAERLIKAADLANLPRVFAIDIAREPHLGQYDDRCRLDAAWAAWIDEQYGSAAHAESVIGRPLWRRDGQLTGPPDGELTADGGHRVAIAVYRRFVDDHMGRQYGEVARFLRGLGLRQLISARSGYGGTGSTWSEPHFPIDPATGATHFDFISPEGWGLGDDERAVQEASFLVAYCRGAAGGKPVAWLEFGSLVGERPTLMDLRKQATAYKRLFDLMIRSRSSACFAWWYPGGLRVDDNSDYGIVNPDGTWRPVVDAFSDLTYKLRQSNKNAPPWRGREVDRDANARGLSGLWDHWRDAYREEFLQNRMEEVRPVSYARETRDIEVRSVGDVAYSAPAPMAGINAEWGRIQIDGREVRGKSGETVRAVVRQEIRLELINTGDATWSASAARTDGTVWVEVTGAGSRRELLQLPAVAPGGRTWVKWAGTDPGVWQLRPFLSGSGPFGEPMRADLDGGR
ncbi:MAG: hypothetical protein V1929_07015 [bacterium]